MPHSRPLRGRQGRSGYRPIGCSKTRSATSSSARSGDRRRRCAATMPAFATKPPEPGDQRQDFLEHLARHRDLGHLKGREAAVAHSVPRRSRSAVWFSALVLPLGHIFGRPRVRHRQRCGFCGGSCCGAGGRKALQNHACCGVTVPGGREGCPDPAGLRSYQREFHATDLTLTSSALTDRDRVR